MKSEIVVLSIVTILSLGIVGCSGSNKASKGSSLNKSDAVDALVENTVEIYEDCAKQIESKLSSGGKQAEVVSGLEQIFDRYDSRMQIEIGSEFDSLETNEIRAYYMAIAGHEAERDDLVDPQIGKVVEKVKNLASGTPMADYVKGYANQFFMRCNSNASTAILESTKR